MDYWSGAPKPWENACTLVPNSSIQVQGGPYIRVQHSNWRFLGWVPESKCVYATEGGGGGGGRRSGGGDLIVFFGSGVGHLTHLLLPGEGIFEPADLEKDWDQSLTDHTFPTSLNALYGLEIMEISIRLMLNTVSFEMHGAKNFLTQLSHFKIKDSVIAFTRNLNIGGNKVDGNRLQSIWYSRF